jgi:hypothetical protein
LEPLNLALTQTDQDHMGKKFSPQELQLYKAIDEILWKDWDPIGISGAIEARDEYQMYSPQAYKLALIGDRTKIADYLFSVAVERMGLTTQRNMHLAIADKILAAKSQAGISSFDE